MRQIISRIEDFDRNRTYAGRFLLRFASIDSTNLFCLENRSVLERAGLVVMAERQTKGRGSKGKQWEAGTGSHLFCSFVVHPRLDVNLIPSMTIFSGLAVFRILKALGAKELSIKWPNDILLANKKVCGILCESRLHQDLKAVVIGIGINISGDSSQFSTELRGKATTLSEHGIETTPMRLLAPLAQEIDSILLRAENVRERKKIFQLWEQASNSIGRQISFNDGQDKGIIIGLDDLGRLMVQTPDGRLKGIESATVEYP